MAQTFEEWWRINSQFMDSDRFEDYARAGWNAAQFALNTELGIAANESAKVERRKVAGDKMDRLILEAMVDGFYNEETMESIIAEAQA